MPIFPNIGNSFSTRYFEIVSENERLRRALGEQGVRGGTRLPTQITATPTIPTEIPIDTLIALATYSPQVYGGVLIQRYPQNFQIIQSAQTLRIASSSLETIDKFKNYQPRKDDISGLSAVQRRPGYYNPSIPGIGFNARQAILAGLDPKTRELLKQIADLKVLTDLITKFTNYARQLELIIEAAGRFITSYITNPLLRTEQELQTAIQKLQENENKYRKVKRLVQLLIKAYRATKTAIIKALFTDGPRIIKSVKKGYEVLRKILALPEIPRIRLVLKWPRFPRIWLTIVDFFARIRTIIDGLKKAYVKAYKAAQIAAMKQTGFEIADEDDIVLQVFSQAKNALREAKANIQAVRNTIEQGILSAENKLKQNIRSTVQNVLNEQQRILRQYNNLKLSGSNLEQQGIIGALDATSALRGTLGSGLEIVGAFNDIITSFGGNPKSLINGPLIDDVRKILGTGESLENQYGVQPANPRNDVEIKGDTITATATEQTVTEAIQKASVEIRKKANELGYNEAVGTPGQDINRIEINGQTHWKVTVSSSWVYVIGNFKFNSTIDKLPQYVITEIATGIVSGKKYPSKVLEIYERSKTNIQIGTGNGSVAINFTNPLNNIIAPQPASNITLPVYRVKANDGARLRKDPSIPSQPNSNKRIGEGGNVIRLLPNNTTVELMIGDFVNANDLTWAKVKLRGATAGDPLTEGWVATRLLDPIPTPFKPVATTVPGASAAASEFNITSRDDLLRLGVEQAVSTPTISTVAYTPAGGYTFSQAFTTELERISGKPIVPDEVKSSKYTGTYPYVDRIEVKTYRPINGDSSVAAWRLFQEVSTFLKSKKILDKEEQTERVDLNGQFIKRTILKVSLEAYMQETVPEGATITDASGATTVYGADISKTTYRPKNTGVRLRENPSTTSKVLETLNTTTQLRYIDGFTQADGELWGKFEIISTKKQGYISTRLLTPTISLTPPPSQPTGTAQATPAASDQFSVTEYFANNPDGVNIRRTPNGNIIKTIPNNTKVKLFKNEQIISAGGLFWAKFQIANEPSVTGYIATRLVRPTITTPTLSAVPTTSPAAPVTPPAAPSSTPTTLASSQDIVIPQWLNTVIQFEFSSGRLTDTTRLSQVVTTFDNNILRNRYTELNQLITRFQNTRPNDLRRNGLLQTKSIFDTEFARRGQPAQPTTAIGVPVSTVTAAASTSPTIQTTTKKIVFVGDSLAVGTSAYVIRQPNSPVKNVVVAASNVGGPTFLQVGGSRIETARVGANTQQIIQFASNSNVQNADVAIISAGSNDTALADGRIDRAPLISLRNRLNAKRYIWIVPIISKARDIVKSVAGQNGDRIVEYIGSTDSAGLHPADGYRSFGTQVLSNLNA